VMAIACMVIGIIGPCWSKRICSASLCR